MEMMKLLIADPAEEFGTALANHLRGLYHIRICTEGMEALEQMLEYKPDVLVLDMMMPGLDGISLLQAVTDAQLHPMVLATTRFSSDYVLEALSDMGVGYVMRKPCDIRAMVSRILDLSQRIHAPMFSRPDPHNAASNMLLTLGIRTKLKGYNNLREAIPLMAKDPGLSLTKELYPAVGKLCNSSGQQVERAIRSAINSAWIQRDDQVWRMYFQPGKNGRVPRPTNGAFISRLADCLNAGTEDLQEKCK